MGKHLNKIYGGTIVGIAIFWSIFQLYTAYFGTLEVWLHRSVHLIFALVLAFLIYLTSSNAQTPGKKLLAVLDGLMLLGVAAVAVYMLRGYPDMLDRAGDPSRPDVWAATVLIILIFEATRRSTGLAVALVGGAFVLYSIWGHYIPGTWGHPKFSYDFVMNHFFNTTLGIFNNIMGVMSTFIFIFVLFGAFLEGSGIGAFFIDFAYSLVGHKAAGAGKGAIIASGLMGTVTGSAIADVVTTGSFTIPLMKKTGFDPNVAAGVAATAGTGAQIMPPVMAGAAFVMSEILGIPYIKIAAMAAFPAILYYWCCYYCLHFYGLRYQIGSVSRKELPQTRKLLLRDGYLFIPILVIVAFMIIGFTPMKAGFWAIVSVLVLSTFDKNRRFNLSRFFKAMEKGAKSAVPLSCACAIAAVIQGSALLTGIGTKFSSLVISFSGNDLFLALILTMAVVLLLGTGMVTVSDYILVAVLAVPALTGMGAPLISAHFFIFYLAIFSCITPPVAVASITAAGLARSNLWKSSFYALFIFGIPALIVPYVIVYHPGVLIFQGSVLDFIVSGVVLLVAFFYLAQGLIGFWKRDLEVWERVVTLGGAFALITLNYWLVALGSLLLFWMTATQLWFAKKSRQVPEAALSEREVP